MTVQVEHGWVEEPVGSSGAARRRVFRVRLEDGRRCRLTQDPTASGRWSDELGYMELDRRGAGLFQVLTEREEKASVAIASNESFGGNIIETGTNSSRLAHTRAPAEQHIAG